MCAPEADDREARFHEMQRGIRGQRNVGLFGQCVPQLLAGHARRVCGSEAFIEREFELCDIGEIRMFTSAVNLTEHGRKRVTISL